MSGQARHSTVSGCPQLPRPHAASTSYGLVALQAVRVPCGRCDGLVWQKAKAHARPRWCKETCVSWGPDHKQVFCSCGSAGTIACVGESSRLRFLRRRGLLLLVQATVECSLRWAWAWAWPEKERHLGPVFTLFHLILETSTPVMLDRNVQRRKKKKLYR
jgi:hypothetical protein